MDYCVVMDLDGNGWSDRFMSSLIHFPTPVLKLATNRTAFFEHMYPPGLPFEQLHPQMDGIMDVIRRMVTDCKTRGEKSAVNEMARQMQRTSALYLDQIGISEALAYTLLTYKNLTSWAFDASVDGFREINMTCCWYVSVPPRFATEVSRRLSRNAPLLRYDLLSMGQEHMMSALSG